MELQALTTEIVAFRDERDWAQFHTPRNLAAALPRFLCGDWPASVQTPIRYRYKSCVVANGASPYRRLLPVGPLSARKTLQP